MTRDTSTYVEGLTLFSDWIADLAATRADAAAFTETRAGLSALMDQSAQSLLFIDATGTVTRCNTRAQELFSFCDLYTRSAYQILPESMVDKILAGHPVREAGIQVNCQALRLSARPIRWEGVLIGALLTLSQGSTAPPGPPPKAPGQADLDDILGQSPAIARVRKMAARVSGSASTVLITGETGTGKGLLARALHYSGARAAQPFVTVNCASIPETLFESELFGYEEGAFTGAKKGGKPGRFELADQGTLFLDEIAEMPLNLQAKLLNVLQDNALQRVGGIRTIPVEVRVIAATNQDLSALVREGRFRSDLFFRLNVIPMDLPPLAARKPDLDQLCPHFLKIAGQRAGNPVDAIAPAVMDLFYAHDWPGNVRELSNVIEFAANMAQGPTITVQDLPDRFLDRFSGQATGRAIDRDTGLPLTDGQESTPPIKRKALKAQTDTIQACLNRYGHDMAGKKRAAQELGISLRTLYRKLSASQAG